MKLALRIVKIVFFVIGALFTIAGIIVFVRFGIYRGNSVIVNAIITQISRSPSSTTVKYTIGSETILSTLNYYSSSYKVGDVIQVYVSTSNPYYCETGLADMILVIVFFSVGISFLFVTLTMIVEDFLLEKNKLKFFYNGKKLVCTIKKIVDVPYIRINRRCAYKIVCEYNDGINEELFTSKIVFSKERAKIGDSIEVYKLDDKYLVNIDHI